MVDATDVVVIGAAEEAGTVPVVAFEEVAAGGNVAVASEFAGEQAARRRSVAIAAPRRLNDRKESPNPINSRRGLTGHSPLR